jgi:hypothetical protein
VSRINPARKGAAALPPKKRSSRRAEFRFAALIIVADLVSSALACLPLWLVAATFFWAIGVIPPLMTSDPLSAGIMAAFVCLVMAALALLPAVIANVLLVRRTSWKRWQAVTLATVLAILPVVVFFIAPDVGNQILFWLF